MFSSAYKWYIISRKFRNILDIGVIYMEYNNIRNRLLVIFQILVVYWFCVDLPFVINV